MGIASVTQNFFDFDSLIVYIVLFYQKLINPLLAFINWALPFRIHRYVFDYFAIGSPFFVVFYWRVFWYEIVNKTHKYDVIDRFLQVASLFVLFVSLFIWPVLCILTIRSEIVAKKARTDKRFTKLRNKLAVIHGDVCEIKSIHEELERAEKERKTILKDFELIITTAPIHVALVRFRLVLILFFIISAFSFGIERWIDPEFLKIKPEHFGIESKSDGGSPQALLPRGQVFFEGSTASATLRRSHTLEY